MSQTRTIRTERRVRGFFGKVIKLVFIAFNLLMIWWIIAATLKMGEHYNALTSDAAKVGANIGATLGYGMILFIWAAGDLILGLFVVLTRGKKLIIEEQHAV